jgi:glycosyltransferase involved in cell wall biosynthesis
MHALLFGTYDTSMHSRIAIIGEGLREAGAQVTQCNAPLGLDTAARVGMLARPWRATALLARLASCWIALARAARRQAPDVVVVGYLGHFDVHLARLLFRRVPIVLDHLAAASETGQDRRLDGGLRQAILRIIDALALRSADIIVVDTDEHLATLPACHRERAVVVPVGVLPVWLDAADPAKSNGPRRPLRVVFFGLYTPLQGTPVIGAALGKIAGAHLEVTMIGNGQELAEARSTAAGNYCVNWHDWVPAAELPGLVAAHDVCLGIFGTSEKALRVVPNKVFQGAAAGCAIVTSDTPPQRRALGEAALLIPPGDAEALAAALLRLADDRAEVARLAAAARALAADKFTPGKVVAPLIGQVCAQIADGRRQRALIPRIKQERSANGRS